MSVKINLAGQRFGQLTVIEESGRIRKEVAWKCKCDCGNYVTVAGYNLRSGHTRSCGCYMKEKAISVNKRHGLYGTRIHGIYTNMKTRCYNPNYYLFNRYGGRGITVCDEWLGENGLLRFWEWSEKNGYDSNKSIDRINNDKGYSPDNCRWVTMKDQQNNRTNNRVVEVSGVSKTMKQWSESLPVSYGTLQRHAKKGDLAKYIEEMICGQLRA